MTTLQFAVVFIASWAVAPCAVLAQDLLGPPPPAIRQHHLRNDVLALAPLAAALAADFNLTSDNVRRGHYDHATNTFYPAHQEANQMLLGAYPSTKRIAITGVAIFGAAAIVEHYTERSRKKWMRLGGRAAIGWQIFNNVRGALSWKRY